jgi:hypothetical protein
MVLLRLEKFIQTNCAPFFIIRYFQIKYHGVLTYKNMRRAIGFIIILYALSHFFSQSFSALDSAATQSLKTIETAAVITQEQMNNRK